MNTNPLSPTLADALAGVDDAVLDAPDVEALSAAMDDWAPAELASYRSAVLAEVAALDGGPVEGRLAVELLALVAAGESGA